MTKSAVELDFFQMEKAQPKKPFERRRSFRDIQGGISKLSPEVLKSVIGLRSSVDNSPNIATSSIRKPETTSDMAPLTIFYKGTVVVFDLSRNKADNILKIAEGGFSKAANTNHASSSSNQCQLSVAIEGDVPIARRKSLQRFFAKRQQRANLPSPYSLPEKVTPSLF